jgi:hypothetical protein
MGKQKNGGNGVLDGKGVDPAEKNKFINLFKKKRLSLQTSGNKTKMSNILLYFFSLDTSERHSKKQITFEKIMYIYYCIQYIVTFCEDER